MDKRAPLPTIEFVPGGPQLAQLGLGCLGLTGGYELEPSDDEAVRTIQEALDLGVNLLDTADMYGAGRNQELIARAIRGRREEVFISSKFGNRWDDRGRPLFADGHQVVDGRPEYARRVCEASLRRLNVDVIDLFTLHRVDQTIPIEESVGGMSDLVDAGLIRYIGLSEAGPQTLRRAAKVGHVAALQSEYSLWWREPEREMLPLCRELGVCYVAHAPLGRGMLTGKITKIDDLGPDDVRRGHPRFQGSNLERNLRLVQVVEQVALRHRCRPAQVALAWLLSRGEGVLPIPGATCVAHVDENTAAAYLDLSVDDLAELERAFTPGVGAGARYSDTDLGSVDI